MDMFGEAENVVVLRESESVLIRTLFAADRPLFDTTIFINASAVGFGNLTASTAIDISILYTIHRCVPS